MTDNESARMVSAHGVMQGYNANALVDEKHQVVVAAAAFGEGDDGVNARPMLEAARRNLTAVGHGTEPLKGKVVSADTSYHTTENLEACREEQVDAYIPDRDFRKRDPRFAEAGRIVARWTNTSNGTSRRNAGLRWRTFGWMRKRES